MTHLDRVFCQDSRSLDFIPENSVDAWITSIPFEQMRAYSSDTRDLGNHQGADFVNTMTPAIREWHRTLTVAGSLFLNFQPQTIAGTISPAAWSLPQALSDCGLHVVQILYVVKTNAHPTNDPRLLKPCVEFVYHAVKDLPRYVVHKDAVRRPSLWAHRDNRPWKYAANGADGGNYLCPALDRLNRLAIKDILAMICGEDANALPIAKTADQSTVHPAKMADAVAEWLIKYGSAPGDTVADNFCGSGTTLTVAKGLGRHFLGVDLNPAYVEQAQAALARVRFGEMLSDEPQPSRTPAPIPMGRPRSDAKSIPTTCICGRQFVRMKPWQTFCSSECRYRHHNARRRSHDAKADAG